MEVSITKEEILKLYVYWKRMTRRISLQRKRFKKNYASLPAPNPDVFRYPDDYTKQEILGQEYLYAVKLHLALLNITPDLTPPRSKRAGNWKPINKVLAMRQIPEMEVA